MYSDIQPKASATKSRRPERAVGPLVPFDELVNETEVEDRSCKQDEHFIPLEDCSLPEPHALLHVTNRRKAPIKKQNSSVVCTHARLLPFCSQLFAS